MQEHYVRQEFVGFGPQNYLLSPACLTPIYWTDVCVCAPASSWELSVLLLLILTEVDSHFITS
jgi:hypothetical protein